MTSMVYMRLTWSSSKLSTPSHTILLLLSCRLNRMTQPSFKHGQTRRSSTFSKAQHFISKYSVSFDYVLFAAFGKHTRVYFFPTQFLCHVIPALLVFDSFLTLPSEIKHIWHRKPKLGSILYILARYPTPMFFLGDIYIIFSTVSPQVCEFYHFMCNFYFH